MWRNGMGRFGRIRLGEGAGEGGSVWVQWLVVGVSAVVAVGSAVPLLVGSLWRSVGGLWGGGRRTYTTRSSFARGSGDYAVVDPDEDELLGDEDEEEV